MTAQPIFPSMLCASQSQTWEVMLSKHAMQSKTLPIKEPTEAQKDEEGEGRDFSGSLA